LSRNESRLQFNRKTTMNTSFHQGSAKIYQFPVRVRPTIASRHEETKSVVDINAPCVSEVACGSGWYHEAAIEDAKRGER
jgi:hypothetical protein